MSCQDHRDLPTHRSARPDRRMLVQAGYYLMTGIWPMVHLRSFEALTGPKPDRFVTEATGLLFAATGTTLAVAARQGSGDRPSRVLSAIVPIMSTFVTLRHRPALRLTYLADATAQCALAAWVAASHRRTSTCTREESALT